MKFLNTAFVMIYATTGLSQIQPESVTFIGAEGVAKQCVHAVFAVYSGTIQTNGAETTDFTPLGSGFFTTSLDGTLLGITCDHIVKAAKEKDLFLGMNTQAGFRRLACIVDYRDPRNDVAILRPQKKPTESVKPLNLYVGQNMFAGEDAISEGLGVLIIGYPLGLGTVQSQNRPVVRFGMIAQNSDANSFLIDGMANHGNSGSPVIALMPNRNPVVGMISAFKQERIVLKDDAGELAAALPYNSGLAIVVKSSVITNAIHIVESKLAGH